MSYLFVFITGYIAAVLTADKMRRPPEHVARSIETQLALAQAEKTSLANRLVRVTEEALRLEEEVKRLGRVAADAPWKGN